MLFRSQERITTTFDEFAAHAKAASNELRALVQADPNIDGEEKRHLLEDIAAEEKLELERLETEAARLIDEERARLVQLVKDLQEDTSMPLQDKLREMHGQEVEAVRLFGVEAEAQLKTLLNNEKNQGVLTTQSMLKARERTTKAVLDTELENLVKSKQADFEQEEADLLAALGDDDDDWWEDTLTREIGREHV